MAAGSYSVVAIRDFGVSLDASEISTHKIPSYQIDAANLATWLTGWGTYKTALDAIILGVIQKEHVAIYDTLISNALPASAFAQRELKLLVTYVGDTTERPFQLEIPTPDLGNLVLGVNDSVLIEDASIMQDWRDAFEAIARAPDDDAETVTVSGARLVGRNL